MDAEAIRRALPPSLTHKPLPLEAYRPSAVLVPIEAGRGVWLTQRAMNLKHHAGQVSFPGGRMEASDPSVEAAALREAGEEVGLVADDAEILGRIDDHITGTGFHMAPVVALVRPGIVLRPDPAEVRAVFCLAFETLLDEGAVRWRQATFRGHERGFWLWQHDVFPIWGATAAILRTLAMRLRGEA